MWHLIWVCTVCRRPFYRFPGKRISEIFLIFSRYGNEDKLVTIFGVMQALVSFVHDSGGDIMRSIIAGDHKFVFLVREHLILVCVSRTTDSTQQLLIQLSYLYNQILSVLTLSSLRKIFKQRRNYDLRRQLSGSEKFLDSLLNMMDTEPGHLLGAVRCLPLENTIRDMVAQSIAQHGRIKVRNITISQGGEPMS